MRLCIDHAVALSIIIAVVPWATLRSAEHPRDAKTRATLYQAEFRDTLEKHAWHIFLDQPGKLGANHALYGEAAPLTEGFNNGGFSSVAMVFVARTATDTQCFAKVEDHRAGYYAVRYSKDGKKLPPPHDAEPETIIAVNRLIDEARKQFASNHPEYLPANKH